jgi:molecular chaperone DnaK
MENKNRKEKIVGIDLGTTNSVVAILEGANPIIIPNSEGYRTTPSIVAYALEGGRLLVGQIAKRQNVVNPSNTFSSIKRFIGCKYDDVISETTRISYKVTKSSDGNIKIYCPILNKEFSPEEISATVLKKLVSDASNYLNLPVTKAIITVPAYFNDSQRLATQDAAKIAGLDVLRILNEPTAAALAYGLEKRKDEMILIFDLGGGTFDVSILEVGDTVFEVLATSGDTHLGGDDFDRAITDFILKKFSDEYGVDLKTEKQSFQRIIEASEKAKISLSTSESTTINIPYIYMINNQPKNINFDFERSTFDNLTKELVLKCKDPVLQALKDSKIPAKKIDEVILVGGSTRIPSVRNLVKSLVKDNLNQSVNPDEVVALGAAVQAGVVSGEIKDLILLDVTPLSLGVETMGGIMAKVIPRNSSIPVRRTEAFSTGSDYQEMVEIHVLQGERDFVKYNKSLGIFKLSGIPKARKGVPQINVTFDIDTDGLLSVSACEQSSGLEQSIKIEGASILSREEVSKLIKESQETSGKDNGFIRLFEIIELLKELKTELKNELILKKILKHYIKKINENNIKNIGITNILISSIYSDYSTLLKFLLKYNIRKNSFKI